MSAIDDLATAIREYPDTHITLEIISFTPAGGTVLNQSEEATFMVRVTNNGLLEMLDVTLSIAATAIFVIDTGQVQVGWRQRLSSSALLNTLTELSAMAAPATTGLR